MRSDRAPVTGAGAASAEAAPTGLEGLRDALARHGERLTPRMRDAARYAVDHPNDIALNPVAAVAEKAGIAPAAFIRMAKALGFGGYSELQRLLRTPLHQAANPTFRERIRHHGGEETLERPDDPAEVLRAFSRANVVSLEHLHDNADSLPLAKAIDLIARARTVHVLGLRRSYAVAAYLAYALNRVGRPAVQITGLGGAIAEQASNAAAGDLLIAVSFPPYAADTLQVCEQVRAAGAKRLAITDALLSPVAQDANLVLEVNDAKLLGFRSLTAAMSLAQALVVGLAFSQRGQRRQRQASRNPPPISLAALQEADC